MIFPIDIHIGLLTIPSHPLFEMLSFFIGYRYYIFLKKRRVADPLSSNAEWWLIIGMAVGAFAGSRLIAALENPDLFIHPLTWMYYIGGQSIAGGLAGGILGVEITKKILSVKRKTGDLFIYPLMLGIIIGRIGCFLKGVSDGTVGLASNLPWAFSQGDGIARHPTSLYEILFIIIFWYLIEKIDKRQLLKQGDLFSLFISFYFIFRLGVEFLKPRNILVFGVSSIQVLSIVVVIYYIQYFIRKYKTNS